MVNKIMSGLAFCSETTMLPAGKMIENAKELMFLLQSHMLIHTKPDEVMECENCGLSYHTTSGLQKHMKYYCLSGANSGGNKNYAKCHKCWKLLANAQSLEKHLATVHQDESKWQWCVNSNSDLI